MAFLGVITVVVCTVALLKAMVKLAELPDSTAGTVRQPRGRSRP
jgi:hypothetical protein